MQQTPVHNIYNQEIFSMLPKGLGRIVEVGSSSGALARAYCEENPKCHYIGIEIDSDYAELSKQYCTEVICGNIENMEENIFTNLFPSDCWIFGDSLEHLYDPWALLTRIRPHLHEKSQIIACIPNAQHWSIQANLSCGQFRYEDSGLMDRTHIRWFTRITISELFEKSGYKIIEGFARTLDDPRSEKIFPVIRAMAIVIGADPDKAVEDATAFQWVVKAIPV